MSMDITAHFPITVGNITGRLEYNEERSETLRFSRAETGYSPVINYVCFDNNFKSYLHKALEFIDKTLTYQ